MTNVISISVNPVLQNLNDFGEVSSKVIAKITDKDHKNVLRDLRDRAESLLLDPKFDIPTIKKGRPKKGSPASHSFSEVWLPLDAAIVLLSGYKGDRASQARNFCVLAVRHFLTLMNEKATEVKAAAQKKLPKGKQAMVVADMVMQENIFGEMVPTPVFRTEAVSEIGREDFLDGKVAFNLKVIDGLTTQVRKDDSELRFIRMHRITSAGRTA